MYIYIYVYIFIFESRFVYLSATVFADATLFGSASNVFAMLGSRSTKCLDECCSGILRISANPLMAKMSW